MHTKRVVLGGVMLWTCSCLASYGPFYTNGVLTKRLTKVQKIAHTFGPNPGPGAQEWFGSTLGQHEQGWTTEGGVSIGIADICQANFNIAKNSNDIDAITFGQKGSIPEPVCAIEWWSVRFYGGMVIEDSTCAEYCYYLLPCTPSFACSVAQICTGRLNTKYRDGYSCGIPFNNMQEEPDNPHGGYYHWSYKEPAEATLIAGWFGVLLEGPWGWKP